MKEKRRETEKKPGDSGGGSIFDSAPPLPENKNVSVASGPYAEELPIAGMSVGEVRRRFKDRFDIDEKSQGIVNGKSADEDVILKAGESLMFVRHAGEKGGQQVILMDDKALVDSYAGSQGSMSVADLVTRMGPGISTGPGVIPNGVRAILSQGGQTLVFWERPPHVASFQWIAEDSPRPYGPGTKYRTVRIALPYLLIAASFTREGNGVPELNTSANECFFRNQPLRSLDDELLYPALLNCSVMKSPNAPLAWICTQYLNHRHQSEDPICNGLESVRYCLLETAFNLSSEHHEGNSWFGASKTKIPQVETVERWESETNKDPLFALEVPWLPTKHTVKQFAERTFKRLGAADTSIKTADDVARIILNG